MKKISVILSVIMFSTLISSNTYALVEQPKTLCQLIQNLTQEIKNMQEQMGDLSDKCDQYATKVEELEKEITRLKEIIGSFEANDEKNLLDVSKLVTGVKLPYIDYLDIQATQEWSVVRYRDTGTIALEQENETTVIKASPNAQGHGLVGLNRVIQVSPNTKYTFSGYVKTQNLKNATGTFIVAQMPTAEQKWELLQREVIPNETGTTDWVRKELSFTTDATTKFIRVICYLFHDSGSSVSGEAFYKDIVLKEVKN